MHYVKDTKKLNNLCEKFNSAKYLAIDTEFIREKTYWPQLCLIQVYDGKEEVIIDPLEKELDLSSFNKILNNKKIIKVIHAGRQDIEIFFNLTKKIPQNIYSKAYFKIYAMQSMAC